MPKGPHSFQITVRVTFPRLPHTIIGLSFGFHDVLSKLYWRLAFRILPIIEVVLGTKVKQRLDYQQVPLHSGDVKRSQPFNITLPYAGRITCIVIPYELVYGDAMRRVGGP